MTKTTIKVTSCSDIRRWYSKHIGEEFTVLKEGEDWYMVREKDEFQAMNYIQKQDAEIVSNS